MDSIVQAKCPHCQKSLRIPAGWLEQYMRCKFCRQTFQARPKASARQPAHAFTPVPAAPIVAQPVLAKAAVPMAQPIQAQSAPPPPSPFLATVPTGADPFDFHAPEHAGGRPYRRRRRNPLRGILVGLTFIAVAAGVLLFAGPQLTDFLSNLDLKQAGKNSEDENNNPSRTSGPQIAQGGSSSQATLPENKAPGSSAVPPRNVTPPSNTGPKNTEPKNTQPKNTQPKTPPDPPKNTEPKTPPDPPKNTTPKDPPNTVPPALALKGFPRRALLISVNDYLFSNPLNYGRPPSEAFAGSRTRDVIEYGLQRYLHFHGRQAFELTDAVAPGLDSPAPMKAVIEQAITDFLEQSRPQDRLILLFSGHVIESETLHEVFLVPIEGDMEEVYDEEKKVMDTLIPLSWVYDKLKASPARQKILILDICRTNLGRGEERPGSAAMGEILDQKLLNPPLGVQVWSSCSKDQYSYEFESGSVFLQAFCLAMQNFKTIQNPEDPLPIDLMVAQVNKTMAGPLQKLKLEQTSRLTGEAPKEGANHDPAIPLAPELVIAPAPVDGGAAGKAVVQSILDEINAAPPPRAGRAGVNDSLRFSALPPFSADLLKEYAKDGYADENEFLKPDMAKKFPLRAAVVRAKQALQESTNIKIREKFSQSGANVKNAIKEEQKTPGKVIYLLEDEALEELMKAEEFLEKEPTKRWKAHYHYVMARLKSRLVFLYEYNYLLANIRSDDLPELEGGATGYRVGSVKKTNIKEGVVREWTRQLRGHWDTIIEEYADTPWALLARREQQTHLGLEWRTYVD
jgi:hypothetical protein